MAVFCDPIFKDPEKYSTGACWLAVLAYAIRIYCDFSGYSDMALGLAHLFGYKLTSNFNMPYISQNVSEFWRRWHISLSSLAARLRLHPAGRQPRFALADLPQPDDHDGARRAVARGGVGLRAVGDRSRADARDPQASSRITARSARGSMPACRRGSGPACRILLHVLLREHVLGALPAGHHARRMAMYRAAVRISTWATRCR